MICLSRERCTASASLSVCHAPRFGSRQAQGALRGRNFHPDRLRYASASNDSSWGNVARAAGTIFDLWEEVIARAGEFRL